MSELMLAFMTPGPMEMMVVGIIALLLFGKRLPEVAKSIGQGFREFKNGVSGIETDVNQSVHTATNERSRPTPVEEQEDEEITAPKFEPPKWAPTESGSSSSNSTDVNNDHTA